METMTDIYSRLKGTARADCWKCFRQLSMAVIYEKKGTIFERAAELKSYASAFNSASGTEHFDVSVADEEFLSSLIDELEEIKSRGRICD